MNCPFCAKPDNGKKKKKVTIIFKKDLMALMSTQVDLNYFKIIMAIG